MDEWLLQLHNPGVIYLSLFFLLIAGAIGFPIPEDIPLILGGIFVHRGSIRLEWAFLVCYSAVVLGDLVIFSIGQRLGPSLFEKEWFKKRVPPRKVKRIRVKLERRSLLMIFLARHLFYLRTATFLTCGAVGMKMRRFLWADCIAAIISVPLMLGLGYLCSEHYDALVAFIHSAKNWSLLLGLIALIGFGIYFYRKRMIERAEAEKTELSQ